MTQQAVLDTYREARFAYISSEVTELASHAAKLLTATELPCSDLPLNEFLSMQACRCIGKSGASILKLEGMDRARYCFKLLFHEPERVTLLRARDVMTSLAEKYGEGLHKMMTSVLMRVSEKYPEQVLSLVAMLTSHSMAQCRLTSRIIQRRFLSALTETQLNTASRTPAAQISDDRASSSIEPPCERAEIEIQDCCFNPGAHSPYKMPYLGTPMASQVPIPPEVPTLTSVEPIVIVDSCIPSVRDLMGAGAPVVRAREASMPDIEVPFPSVEKNAVTPDISVNAAFDDAKQRQYSKRSESSAGSLESDSIAASTPRRDQLRASTEMSPATTALGYTLEVSSADVIAADATAMAEVTAAKIAALEPSNAQPETGEAEAVEPSTVDAEAAVSLSVEPETIEAETVEAEPTAVEPLAAEPDAAESISAQPGAAEPETAEAEPAAVEPSAAETEAAESISAQPGAAEPETAEAEPAAVEPSAAETGAAESLSAEPEAADRGVADVYPDEIARPASAEIPEQISAPVQGLRVEEVLESSSFDTSTESPIIGSPQVSMPAAVIEVIVPPTCLDATRARQLLATCTNSLVGETREWFFPPVKTVIDAESVSAESDRDEAAQAGDILDAEGEQFDTAGSCDSEDPEVAPAHEFTDIPTEAEANANMGNAQGQNSESKVDDEPVDFVTKTHTVESYVRTERVETTITIASRSQASPADADEEPKDPEVNGSEPKESEVKEVELTELGRKESELIQSEVKQSADSLGEPSESRDGWMLKPGMSSSRATPPDSSNGLFESLNEPVEVPMESGRESSSRPTESAEELVGYKKQSADLMAEMVSSSSQLLATPKESEQEPLPELTESRDEPIEVLGVPAAGQLTSCIECSSESTEAMVAPLELSADSQNEQSIPVDGHPSPAASSPYDAADSSKPSTDAVAKPTMSSEPPAEPVDEPVDNNSETLERSCVEHEPIRTPGESAELLEYANALIIQTSQVLLSEAYQHNAEAVQPQAEPAATAEESSSQPQIELVTLDEGSKMISRELVGEAPDFLTVEKDVKDSESGLANESDLLEVVEDPVDAEIVDESLVTDSQEFTSKGPAASDMKDAGVQVAQEPLTSGAVGATEAQGEPSQAGTNTETPLASSSELSSPTADVDSLARGDEAERSAAVDSTPIQTGEAAKPSCDIQKDVAIAVAGDEQATDIDAANLVDTPESQSESVELSDEHVPDERRPDDRSLDERLSSARQSSGSRSLRTERLRTEGLTEEVVILDRGAATDKDFSAASVASPEPALASDHFYDANLHADCRTVTHTAASSLEGDLNSSHVVDADCQSSLLIHTTSESAAENSEALSVERQRNAADPIAHDALNGYYVHAPAARDDRREFDTSGDVAPATDWANGNAEVMADFDPAISQNQMLAGKSIGGIASVPATSTTLAGEVSFLCYSHSVSYAGGASRTNLRSGDYHLPETPRASCDDIETILPPPALDQDNNRVMEVRAREASSTSSEVALVSGGLANQFSRRSIESALRYSVRADTVESNVSEDAQNSESAIGKRSACQDASTGAPRIEVRDRIAEIIIPANVTPRTAEHLETLSEVDIVLSKSSANVWHNQLQYVHGKTFMMCHGNSINAEVALNLVRTAIRSAGKS